MVIPRPFLLFLKPLIRTRISIPVILCISITLVGCTASGLEAEITTFLDSLATTDRLSGVVLVARDGEPILELAYGLANRDHEIGNEIDTKFNLGSMNKMFTAVATLQLVQQGRLALDDTIIEHLPDYPNQEVASQVRIHHLLTHTSGLGDFFTPEFFETSKDRFRTLNDHLPLFVDKPLQFEPGTQSSYSNAGFLVLGLIIEEVTGQTYFDYVKENIFQPCGMTNTESYETDEIVPNIATGYSRLITSNGSLASNISVLPVRGSSAGGGYSTAGDLLNFSNCLMNHELLNSELTDTLLESKVEAPYVGEGVEYGYGFVILVRNGHTIVGHGGGAPGVCSNLDIFTDLGYAVVILTNRDFDCRHVRTQIREILLE